MQNITIIITAITGEFIVRTLVLGLITFFIFFSVIRVLDKSYSKIILHNILKKWDMLKHGNAIILVRDGVLQLDKLYMANITTQQIYAALRSKNINHLCEVERLFLIPGGEFSIYKKQDSANGLTVLHYTGKEILNAQGEA